MNVQIKITSIIKEDIAINEQKRSPVIIDTDPGIDDAGAIFWVLANEDKLDVKALTIVNGNIGLDGCVTNALRVLETAGRTDIPVYRGAYRPIMKAPMNATWIHGQDGLGDAGLPFPTAGETPGYAPAEMARIIRESPEPVTILSLAPLTNVALAILLDPQMKKNVKEILFMGGAVNVIGNDTPVASFNAAVDPEATHIVYHSGIPVVQLGLDICDMFTETEEDFRRLRDEGGRIGGFLYKMTEEWRKRNAKAPASRWYKTREDGIGMNDVAATAYLINPDWFTCEDVVCDIQLEGLSAGQTVVDFRGWWKKEPNVRFAYDVDSRAAVERWIEDIIRCDERC